MTRLRIWWSRLLGQFSKRRFEEDLDQEVQFHLEMLKSEHDGRDVDDETARLMAQRAFGGIEQMKEDYRDRRALPWIETLFQDGHAALRSLRLSSSSDIAAQPDWALFRVVFAEDTTQWPPPPSPAPPRSWSP